MNSIGLCVYSECDRCLFFALGVADKRLKVVSLRQSISYQEKPHLIDDFPAFFTLKAQNLTNGSGAVSPRVVGADYRGPAPLGTCERLQGYKHCQGNAPLIQYRNQIQCL